MFKLDFTGYQGESATDLYVPEHTRETLRMYVEEGYDPGGFVTAVLCNDLMGAVSRADSTNIRYLRDIAMFVYNRVPSRAYGGPGLIEAYKAEVWAAKTPDA